MNFFRFIEVEMLIRTGLVFARFDLCYIIVIYQICIAVWRSSLRCFLQVFRSVLYLRVLSVQHWIRIVLCSYHQYLSVRLNMFTFILLFTHHSHQLVWWIVSGEFVYMSRDVFQVSQSKPVSVHYHCVSFARRQICWLIWITCIIVYYYFY